MMPVMCFLIKVPYGKFVVEKWWLPLIRNTYAFFLMEIPNLLVVVNCLIRYGIPHPSNGAILFCFFAYAFNRAIIYPLSIVRVKRNWPIQLVLLGTLFTTINSLNQISVFYGDYDFWNINVIIGLFVWIYGFYETWKADRYLLDLAAHNKGYVRPRGRWFELISCPHYAFEILMWFGYFVMSMSYESFLFLMATIFNVLPRALYTNDYYNKKFKNDGLQTYAVIPFLL